MNLSQRNAPQTRRRRQRRRTSNALGFREPAQSSISYNGPTRMPDAVRPEARTFELRALVPVTLDGSGNFAQILHSSNTSATNSIGVDSASQWTEYTAIYSEYRVLSLRVEFHPGARGTSQSAFSRPMLTAVVRDTTTVPTSNNDFLGNPSFRMVPFAERWVRDTKMLSTDEAQFCPIASANDGTFAVIVLSTGGAVSVTAGLLLIRWMVQFRTQSKG